MRDILKLLTLIIPTLIHGQLLFLKGDDYKSYVYNELYKYDKVYFYDSDINKVPIEILKNKNIRSFEFYKCDKLDYSKLYNQLSLIDSVRVQFMSMNVELSKNIEKVNFMEAGGYSFLFYECNINKIKLKYFSNSKIKTLLFSNCNLSNNDLLKIAQNKYFNSISIDQKEPYDISYLEYAQNLKLISVSRDYIFNKKKFENFEKLVYFTYYNPNIPTDIIKFVNSNVKISNLWTMFN